ncbi:MAG: metallophosphoesterase, partial [Thermoplasmata archaeon]
MEEPAQTIFTLFLEKDSLLGEGVIDYFLSCERPISEARKVIDSAEELPCIVTVEYLTSIKKPEKTNKKEEAKKEEQLESNAHNITSGKAESIAQKDAGIRMETVVSPAQIQSPLNPSLHVTVPLSQKIQAENHNTPVETKDFPNDLTKKKKYLGLDDIPFYTNPSFRPLAREYKPEFVIGKDITGCSSSEGTTENLVKYFNSRYTAIKRILRKKPELSAVFPIDRISRTSGDVAFIGIVKEIRKSKKGNCIVEIEDDTGCISVLLSKNNSYGNSSRNMLDNEGISGSSVDDSAARMIGEDDDKPNFGLVNDEVIGIIGKKGVRSELVYADRIVRPDIPFGREPKRSEVPVCAAFASDIHVGSRTFLGKNWNRFVRWLRGELDVKTDLASKIKYLVLPGDIADGIGVFPGHEEELEIKDIYEQYDAFAKLIENIPDYIEIIVHPGNHDAVRLAEPQPAFPKEISKPFDARCRITGNPCYFSIHGVDVLSYHGRSFDDLITNIAGLTYNTPLEAMK